MKQKLSKELQHNYYSTIFLESNIICETSNMGAQCQKLEIICHRAFNMVLVVQKASAFNIVITEVFNLLCRIIHHSWLPQEYPPRLKGWRELLLKCWFLQ